MRLPVTIIGLMCLSGTVNAADMWAHIQPMTVVMVDDKFEPDHLTFQAGQAYALHLENNGTDLHEFTAPDFLKAATLRDRRQLSTSGDIVVRPGHAVTVDLIAPKAGKYDLTCADHDWDGMVGTIAVK